MDRDSVNLDSGRKTSYANQPSLGSATHPVELEEENTKLDAKTSNRTYIKKALKAFAASALFSPAGLIIAPIFAFILLLGGIAALPYWQHILLFSTFVAILAPSTAINISLTRGIPRTYRIASVIFYIAVLVLIEIMFFRFIALLIFVPL